MANENVVARFEGQVIVEELVSSKGNPYKAVFVLVKGQKVRLGFCDVYVENALLKAGIKL